jgi:hypothetical protein
VNNVEYIASPNALHAEQAVLQWVMETIDEARRQIGLNYPANTEKYW